jgi:hypothetical protein
MASLQIEMGITNYGSDRVMTTKYVGYEGGGGSVQKIVNRNNYCTWDSSDGFQAYANWVRPNRGLDILGMDGLEKEN